MTKPKVDPLMRLSGAGIGRIFSLSRNAVSAWDCPRNADKTYCLADVVQWREARHAAALGEARRRQDSTPLDRYRTARAEKEEISLGEIRADTVSLSEVRFQIVQVCTLAKSSLLKLPRALATKLERKTAGECCSVVEQAIIKWLDEFVAALDGITEL